MSCNIRVHVVVVPTEHVLVPTARKFEQCEFKLVIKIFHFVRICIYFD